MFFLSFAKGPRGFVYVFIITGEVTTLEPIYGPTLLTIGFFFLGGDQQVSDGSTTFEVGLYAIPPTDLCDTFTKTLCIKYDNVTLGLSFIDSRLGTHSILVVSLTRNLSGGLVKPFLHLVQSPFGIFTLG